MTLGCSVVDHELYEEGVKISSSDVELTWPVDLVFEFEDGEFGALF